MENTATIPEVKSYQIRWVDSFTFEIGMFDVEYEDDPGNFPPVVLLGSDQYQLVSTDSNNLTVVYTINR